MSFLKRNAIVFLALLMSSATAGVNLKNGNFYISYTDIVVPGSGKTLEMTRTYNSKSTEKGWFGFGWGNVFETKLIKSPDGCVFVHEHGAGGKTRFCPKNPVDPKSASKKIVDAMRTKSAMTASAENSLMKRLMNNAELRHVYARKFGVKTNIAKGSILSSNQRGIQTIEVLKDGYLRKSNDGKKEYFNKKGKLQKIVDKNNYKVEFTYKSNNLYSIKDSKAKQIYFKWNSNRRVKAMWSAKDKIASFKYNNVGDLVFSQDVGGHAYGYKYDNNHNLTKIIYNPNRKKGTKEDSMKMEYQRKTYFIAKITDRNSDTTGYKYGSNPKNPKDHYWTDVTKKGFNNKVVTNRYEYEIKTKPDGSRYTYRIMTRINGIKTDTIYSQCCGLPIKIARGKVVTNFEYNDKGLLIKKESTRGDFVKISYDKKHNKISKVVNSSGTTKFTYDKKGNLIMAQNDKGKSVLLVYNSKGKIQTMVDKQKKGKRYVKRALKFKYNSLGKPVEIEMSGVGKIQVAYDNYGEIKRVESKQGHKMALQVTQAFQNLLAIVKPAGVNLNL